MLERRPDLLIDNCAAGGRRNDLESLRRSVPLWKTDFAYNSVACQGMYDGLSLWVPYHGTGTVAADNVPYLGSGATPVETYAFWSNTGPSTVFTADVREKLDYEALRRLFAQWRQIAPYYSGDFYPLTPYSIEPAQWIGWQFHRPDRDAGMAQIFRRAESPYETARFKLAALDPNARYEVACLVDEPTPAVWSGRELREQGLRVILKEQPAAGVFVYRRWE